EIEIVAGFSIELIEDDPVVWTDVDQPSAMCDSAILDRTVDVIEVGERNLPLETRRSFGLPPKRSSRCRLTSSIDDDSVVRGCRAEEISTIGSAVVDRSSGIDQEFVAPGEKSKRQCIRMTMATTIQTQAAAVENEMSIVGSPPGALSEVAGV